MRGAISFLNTLDTNKLLPETHKNIIQLYGTNILTTETVWKLKGEFKKKTKKVQDKPGSGSPFH